MPGSRTAGTCRLRRRRPTTAPGTRSPRHAPSSASRGTDRGARRRHETPGPLRLAAVPRRAPSTRWRRPCSRRASPPGCGPGVLEAGRRDPRAHAGRLARRPRRRGASPALPAAASAPARRSSPPAAAAPASGPLRRSLTADLQPHGRHRAGPRGARGDRLDRRRVHHRLAAHDPLLPHDAGRPDRLRLGRRPDRPRRRRPRPRRGRPDDERRGRRPTCCGSSRSSRGARSTHAWGGPIDVSPTHLPVIRSRRRAQLRRLRLHRQRRRARADGRPRARVDGARPSRRADRAADRRPAARPRPSRAVPLRGRRDRPPGDHPQGGGRGAGPARRTRSRA